jgi:hypothetical protein
VNLRFFSGSRMSIRTMIFRAQEVIYDEMREEFEARGTLGLREGVFYTRGAMCR